MKFLKFPWLVQNNVLQQLSLTDQLFLSLCSLKTKRVIRQMNRRKFEIWLRIEDSRSGDFSFLIEEGTESESFIHFSWIRSQTFLEPTAIRFGDFSVQFRIRTAFEYKEIQLYARYTWSKVLSIHEYICDLFRAPSDLFLKLNTEYIDKFSQPDMGKIKKTFWTADDSVHTDELNTFYQTHPGQEFVMIDGPIQRGVSTKNNALFKIPTLYLTDSGSFATSIFNSFEGEHLLCADASGVHSGTIANFVKAWMKSRIYLIVKTRIILSRQDRRGLGSIKTEEVLQKLQGLTLEKWDPSKRNRHYEYKSQIQNYVDFDSEDLDCQDGLDIVRKGDGKRATIKLSPEHFMFFVWE